MYHEIPAVNAAFSWSLCATYGGGPHRISNFGVELKPFPKRALNPPTQRHGAWIFVSHSHRDLEKVRPIRHELERRGYHPLLLFLKCLADNDARLPALLREEIQAR